MSTSWERPGSGGAAAVPPPGAGTAAGAAAGHEQGLAVLQDLLRRPPAEVTRWVLDQAGGLSRSGVDVGSTQIFQLAGALNSVPVEQKQALVRSAVAGFGELPVERRAEAVRLAMQTADIVHQAEGLDFQRHMDREHAVALQGLVAAERGGTGPAGPGQALATPLRDAEAPPAAPPLVKNFLRVAQEAKFNEMPRAELASIAHEAQAGAAHLAQQPQGLVDVVRELKPEEREQLTDALVEARVVPEEQRAVLEEAVRPGGYADKLGSLLRLLDSVQAYAHMFVIVPLAELILAFVLGYLPCGTPLAGWLRFDAVLSLGTAGAGYLSCHYLLPVYERLRADPMGAAQRWQNAAEVDDWTLRLEMALPGVYLDTYRAGAIGIVGVVVLVLIGEIWAVIGILDLIVTMAFGCSGATVFFCIAFVGVRLGILVAAMLSAYYVLDEVQRLRSRAPMLGSSQLPMVDDPPPRAPRFQRSTSPP